MRNDICLLAYSTRGKNIHLWKSVSSHLHRGLTKDKTLSDGFHFATRRDNKMFENDCFIDRIFLARPLAFHSESWVKIRYAKKQEDYVNTARVLDPLLRLKKSVTKIA